MDRPTSSSGMNIEILNLKRFYLKASLIAHALLFCGIISISLFLNHGFNKNRIEGSLSTFQRLHSQQSFREISFLSKSFLSENFTSINIYNHLGKSVFTSGKKSFLNYKIKEKFFTDKNSGISNGELVVYYSFSHVLINSFLYFFLVLIITIPFCLKFFRNALRRQLSFIEIEKTKEMNLLARRVSHDLRSPISVIKDVLDKGTKIDEELLRSSLKRLDDIANNLLDKTRENKSEVVSVEEVINGILAEKRAIFPDINMIFTVSDELIQTQIIRSEFERILSNLLNNALEECCSIGESSLKINLKAIGPTVYLYICNKSREISEELISKLNGGVTVSTKSNGNGLGVSTALSVLRSIGGDLKIKYNNGMVETAIELIKIEKELDRVIVHIDDDMLIRISWEQQAKKCGVTIHSFDNFENTKGHFKKLSKDVSFYVDQDLGEGHQSGVDSLLELYEQGFRNLFLTTGYEKEEFEEFAQKITVLDKRFPINIS
jgi:signal transduction histidine kinase